MATLKKKVVGTTPVAVEHKSLLQKAHEVIYGDRENTYGNPSKNLQQIAAYWSIHLSGTTGENIVLTPDDVCEMMILLKVARLGNDPTHFDSMLDIAGYAALQERIQSGK
jgi:hypothetical protein